MGRAPKNADTVTSITLASPGAAATAAISPPTYTITPSAAVGTGLSNYTINYVTGTLTVTPAPLTVTATNVSKQYGDSYTFDTTTPSTDFSVTGLKNSDTVTSSTVASPGAAATAAISPPTYTITPSAAVGTGLSNYTINYVTGTLTVTPAPLTVTATNVSKQYGDSYTFDTTTPSTDFSVTGLKNSDTV